MASGEYYLNKNNGSSIDEKKILAESGKVLGFNSSLNPVMVDLAAGGNGLSVAFTNQTSIVINHNFGAFPLIQILNASNQKVIPLTITHGSANQTTVTFSAATSGTALLYKLLVGSFVMPPAIELELFVETTRVNLFDNLIANSLLVPQQWYLITDYQTEGPIVGTSPIEIYTAAVEQIFVQASSINTLYARAYSKDFPDEELLFKQVISPEANSNSASMYGGDFYLYYENGVQCSTPSILAHTFELITLELTALNIYDLSQDQSTFYINAYDDISGIGIYLDTNNLGVDWTLGADGKTIYLLDEQGGNMYLSQGFTFNGALSTNGFIECVFTSFSLINESLDISFDLTSKTTVTFVLGKPLFDNRSSLVSLDAYDPINDISLHLEEATLNNDWSYNSGTGVITLLNGTQGYASSDFDFRNILYYGSLNAEISTTTKIYYGRITQRNNLTKNIIVDADYRGTKFRRYAPLNSSVWTAGTYAQGAIVTKDGYYFIAPYSTNSVPSTSTNQSCWGMLFPTSQQYSVPLGNVNVAGMYISPDPAAFADFDMFFDLSFTSSHDISIRGAGNTTDCIFRTNNVHTVDLKVSASLTLLEAATNLFCTLNSTTIIVSAEFCSGMISGGIYFQLTYSNFSRLSNSYMRFTYSQDFVTLNNSFLAGSFQTSRVVFIESCRFGNRITDCAIDKLTNGTFPFAFYNNTIQSANAITCLSTFYNNTFLGPFTSNYFGGECSGNMVIAQMDNNTLGRFDGNKIFARFASNTILGRFTGNEVHATSAGNNLVNTSDYIASNIFLESFGFNTWTGIGTMGNNIFKAQVSYNNGASNFRLSNNFFGNIVYNNSFSGSFNSSVQYNLIVGSFSGNSFNNILLENNSMLNTFHSNIFNGAGANPLTVMDNVFLGNCSGANWVGDVFRYNTVGINFMSSTMAAGISATYNKYADSTSNFVIISKSFIIIGANSGAYSGFGVSAPTSAFHTKSISTAYVEKTYGYTAGNHDKTINCIANTFTISLPQASTVTEREYTIVNSGAGVITIDPYSTELINGALTKVLNAGEKATIQSTGTGWLIIGS